MRPDRIFLFKHPAHFIALGFGAGLATKAPGTWGTLVAVPIALSAQFIGGNFAVLALSVISFIVGCWAADVAGRAIGVADHGGIVIDEIAAFLGVLFFTPPGWLWMAVAFLLFRVFDIWKPWPIRVADRRLKGGFGVMFDDVLAAAYAVICIFVLRSFL